ncbi:MAG: outer membrane beta-barrel protein [Prevotella sp.]|nr:outer membrane beta-barrel protein [Candidatus Equicola stercoris]
MKKLVLLVALVACSLGASAQIWVGGELGLGFKNPTGDAKTELNDNTQTEFRIQPEIGYSLNEKWDIAIGLGFTSMTNEGNEKDNNYTKFNVNPYARYTFFNTGKVGFFVDGGVDFGILSPKEGDSTNEFSVALRPGIKFAASEKITLVAHLGGLGYKTVQDRYNEFGFNVDGRALSFGMYWTF